MGDTSYSLSLTDTEKDEIRTEAARYGIKPATLARVLILGAIRRGRTEELLRRYEPLMKRNRP